MKATTGLVVLLVFLSVAQGQGPAVDFPLVSVANDKITLRQALEELRKQTGVKVGIDLEGDPTFALQLTKATFWEALDTIAAQSKSRVLVSAKQEPPSLVASAPNDQTPPTAYDGNFRARITQVANKRDLTTTGTTTTLTLELAWLPNVQPLFLDTQIRDLKVRDGDGKVVTASDEGGTLAALEGRGSSSLEITLADIPRTQQHLRVVEGKLTVVAPSKMLAFRFDADLKYLAGAAADGAVRRLVQGDVVCRVDRIVTEKERWSVRMALEFPAPERTLESYQAGSLVANNELVLLHRDGKRKLTPNGFVVDVVSSRRATVTYHFRDAPGKRLGRAEDWKPSYRAPARIIEVPVRFGFKQVALP